MPLHTVIIGVGNEYRGDDAAGLLVVRMLKVHEFPGVELVECSGDDSTVLLDLWKTAEHTILVDASCSGSPAGTITRFDPINAPVPRSTLTSSHAFSPTEAIELARQLGELPRSLAVYAIEGKNFAAGTILSPEVEQAARGVTRRVIADLQSFS